MVCILALKVCRMGKLIDLSGQKFGRLTVIERAGVTVHGEHAKWVCLCECGNATTVIGKNLRNGNTTSCGCFRKEQMSQIGKANKTHGKSHSRLHMVWAGMIGRCNDPNKPCYKYYGGRGITVCDEWRNNFQAFYDWAMGNGYDPNALYGECTIDRINNDGNYEPSNCRWVTMAEQNNNKR